MERYSRAPKGVLGYFINLCKNAQCMKNVLKIRLISSVFLNTALL